VGCTDYTYHMLWSAQITHILDCGIYKLHTHSDVGCTDYTHTKLAVQSNYMIWCMMWVVQITHILCCMMWVVQITHILCCGLYMGTHILAYGLYRSYTYQVVGFACSTYTRLMKHHNFDNIYSPQTSMCVIYGVYSLLCVLSVLPTSGTTQYMFCICVITTTHNLFCVLWVITTAHSPLCVLWVITTSHSLFCVLLVITTAHNTE
jgi:hypothetical protein